MRKIIVLLTALAVLLSLGTAVFAESPALEITDMPATADQTIYMSVFLNQSVTGDAMGISYSYDTSLLEALPGSCMWEKEGLLEDFSYENNGVWAAAKAQDLSGKICILAFRVKSGVTFTETTVSCTLTVKNGANGSTTLTAEGKIYTVCDHNYGSWEKTDSLNHHTRTCSLCAKTESQSHSWDNGVTTDHPTNPHLDLLTYTCTVCGMTRSVEIQGSPNPETPTEPPKPTESPEELPTLPPMETMPPMTESPLPEELATFPTAPQFGANDKNPPENQIPSGSTNNPTNQPPAEPTAPIEPTESTKPTEPADQIIPDKEFNDFNDMDSDSQGSSNTNQNTSSGSQNSSGNNQNKPSGNQNSSGNNQNKPSGNQNAGTQPTESRAEESTVAPTVTVTPNSSHDHSHQNGSNAPVAVPIPEGAVLPEETQTGTETTVPEVPEDGHDHDHTTGTPEISVVPLILAFLCVGGALALTLLLIKRTKHNKRK